MTILCHCLKEATLLHFFITLFPCVGPGPLSPVTCLLVLPATGLVFLDSDLFEFLLGGKAFFFFIFLVTWII